MMNQEIARRWADALESGQYKQARGSLRVVLDSRLGVLGEVAGAIWCEDDCLYFNDGDTSGTSSATLPNVLSEHLGLGEANPYFAAKVDGQWGVRAASELNDDYGFSFAQIATLVRDQLIDRQMGGSWKLAYALAVVRRAEES